MQRNNAWLSSAWKKAAKLIVSMKKEKANSGNQTGANNQGLKSLIHKLALTGLVGIFLFGGGYEDKRGNWSIKTEGAPGLLRSIDESMQKAEDRRMSRDIFETYKDSVSIKDPDKLLRMLKQFRDHRNARENKETLKRNDIPK